MRFRDIIGQEGVKRQLRLSVNEGRVPHAQLFAGRQGVGKLLLALAYAQYLNCPNRTEDDSCGVCPNCLQMEKLQYPDLHFVFPIVKTDSSDVCDDFLSLFRQMVTESHYFSMDDWNRAMGVENKQSIIYEKESAEILRKLSFKPFGNGYKIMIIWQPERMNVTCANKILKILEEPPQKTLFLFVSENPEQLLPTIISRLQLIRIPLLSEEEIESAVYEKVNDPLKAKDIARLSQGSYLRALKMLEQSDQAAMFMDDFIALMRNAWSIAYNKDYVALQRMKKWSEKMADSKEMGRERQKAFLQFVQRQIRENFIYNFGSEDITYLTVKEKAFSVRFAPFITDRNVELIMSELSKAERQISQNGNAKIIFFDMCLQMIVFMKK